MKTSPSSAARLRDLLLAMAILLWVGCAPRVPEVTPADIPTLEEQVATQPTNPDLRTQLGIAYYRADRFQDAREALERAVEDGAEEGATFLFLGLAHEALEDWAGAREAYTEYLDAGIYDPLRDDIRNRLTVIVRQEMRAEARQALDREDELADEPPAPRSIAVFPFRIVTDDEMLEPLSVALADMMITDLAISGAVTVLERTRIQSLLDEMALTEAGYVEPATGARAGRLLRAEHVVQGALTDVGDEVLRLDSDVRHTVDRASRGEITAQRSLEELFELEKDAVFRILDVLNVELTPGEREAILENRTDNVLSFLTYGQGLQAMDRGAFGEAADFFRESSQLDPGFLPAQTRLQDANQLQEGSEATPERIAQQAAGEMGTGTVAAEGSEQTTASKSEDLLERTSDETNPNRGSELMDQGNPQSGTDQQSTERNPTQEAQGDQGFTEQPVGIIRIQIPRPGGGGG